MARHGAIARCGGTSGGTTVDTETGAPGIDSDQRRVAALAERGRPAFAAYAAAAPRLISTTPDAVRLPRGRRSSDLPVRAAPRQTSASATSLPYCAEVPVG